ncbi:deoxypodophyllotoxin synthase-like [Lycium barbarum]|uniref:deoxypodophyllotoxin synthase-like n=1 Tax=Lycium barbarum TaxID=112863 RepID=UPI00293E1C56|nr:deoxypodophyllotoxin synthase-like [Lycium barbarum]
MVFESYGVEKCYDSIEKSTTYLLRLIKCRASQLDESNVGSHTDKCLLTILHQNQVIGLEVKTKDGAWGKHFWHGATTDLSGPEHGVMVRETEPRYTLAQFSYIDGMIVIPEELVDEKHPMRFLPFNNLELLDFFAEHVDDQMEYTVRAFCGI